MNATHAALAAALATWLLVVTVMVAAIAAAVHRMEGTMATKGDFDGLVAEMNDATNAISARIDALIAKQAAGGMTAEEEAAVRDEFAALSQRLKDLGADPNNPVPPVA